MKVIYKTEQRIHHSVKSSDEQIEIDGLLVNETKTKPGNEFYNLFYNEWKAPAEARNYQITVSERPFRLITIMIAVFVNENLVYQDILQSNQDTVKTQTLEAISRTQNYLAKYKKTTKQPKGENPIAPGSC
jgi:curli production assembly/transport component CsgE